MENNKGLNLYAFFRKRLVEYKDSTIEILCFESVEIGLNYYTHDGKIRIRAVTGDTNLVASIIDNDNKEELDVICQKFNFKLMIEKFKTNNINDIRRQLLKYYFKYRYFMRNVHTNNKLIAIKDEELLELAQKEFGKERYQIEKQKESEIQKIYELIRETIISQDEQIKGILTSIFKNQELINLTDNEEFISKVKDNILICGPTGTGKTEILTKIANYYHVPVVIEGVTNLSETGYEGDNVTDLLKRLYLSANNNIELAERGILVLDEFDKLAEKEVGKEHVSRTGVQRSLLKIFDGATYYINGVKFNTSKLTIVALGAFNGITNDDNYQNLTAEKIQNYGIMRELIGRFSKIVKMNNLSREDFRKILLESNNSPLNLHKKFLALRNVDIIYEPEFIDWVVTEALNLNTGARALKSVFEEYIGPYYFDIFDGKIESLVLNAPVKDISAEDVLKRTLTKKS